MLDPQFFGLLKSTVAKVFTDGLDTKINRTNEHYLAG